MSRHMQRGNDSEVGRRGRARPPQALPVRSRLATAVLCALGYAGATAAADNIDPDGQTGTTLEDASDGSLSIRTETVRNGVGFNSFSRFRLDSGRIVDLHHHGDTEHLVNLVRDERIEITDGTVNSLVDGEVGGHLVFADPHGMLVGAEGQINAGKLTLTTPTTAFMDSVVDGGAFGNTAATDALVNGTLNADDIRSDAVIEINGEINTTGGVQIHAGRVRVDEDGAIEAGTKDGLDNISDAVNVSDVATGVAAEVTDGRIEIVAETDESIADGRTGEPLEDASSPPTDDEFAVAIGGRLAATRTDRDVDAGRTGIHVEGRDVRISGTVESVNGGENRHKGGQIAVRAIDDPDADPDNSRAANVDIDGSVEAHDVEIEGRRVALDGEISAQTPAPLTPALSGEVRIDAAQDITGDSSLDSRIDAHDDIVLNAGGDIGTSTDALSLNGETLQADAAGDVHLEMLGDIEIPDLDAGGDVRLAGAGHLVYGRVAAGRNLGLTGFASVLGDGGLRSGAGADSLLASNADLGVEADVIGAAADFTGATRVESGAALDLQADTIRLVDADAGTSLYVNGRRQITLGTVTSGGDQLFSDGAGDAGSIRWNNLDAGGDVTINIGGDVVGMSTTGDEGLTVTAGTIDLGVVDTSGTQDYTGDFLLYDRLEAGTWSGADWGEGAVTREADIRADIHQFTVAADSADSHIRATGSTPDLQGTTLIDPDDLTGTAYTFDGTVFDITTETLGANGEIGFNSFHHFRVGSEYTANLHLPDGAQHLVNIVHDSAVEIRGTVNSLVDGQTGGHLVFADPFGMVVGRQGTINAGRLSLTTPDDAFLGGVIAESGAIDAGRADALVEATVSADRFGNSALTHINGSINTLGAVNVRGDRIQVGGAIESGTRVATGELGLGDVPTDGRIVVVAETEGSVGDGRDSNPLEDTINPPVDSEFAVSVDGRLAVARSDTESAASETKIDITGTDVRLGAGAELDAQGDATFNPDGSVADAGEYAGGHVTISAGRGQAPADDLWNPASPLGLDGNLDLAGDIAAFNVAADARYIDVGGSITSARRADLVIDLGPLGTLVPEYANGDISLSAVRQRYSMWGTLPVETGIRVDGNLTGHSLDLQSYASAIVGRGPEDGVVTRPDDDDLAAYAETLDAQMGGLLGAPSYGLAFVADADSTIVIDDGAELNATIGIDIASGAYREVSTQEMLKSFFSGIAMVRGEVHGETRVNVDAGSSLAAGGDIRLTGVSDTHVDLKSQVVNANPLFFHALSYAHGVVDTDTIVDVDHGAWLGDADQRIGGLDVTALTVNDISVTAKAYKPITVTGGLAAGIAIADVDTYTRAVLNADVAATDDVHVTARSDTEHLSNFTDVAVGLVPNALAQIIKEEGMSYAGDSSSYLEGDELEDRQQATLGEGLLSMGALGVGNALAAFGIGAAGSVGLSDVYNKVTSGIGTSAAPTATPTDGLTPEIRAGGDVTVYAERVMHDVRMAGGSTVAQVMPYTDAYALGLVKTDITNDVNAVIGPGTVINARHVGMSAVSDVPLEIDYGGDGPFSEGFDIKEYLDKYFNICAGICNNVTTTYVASSATSGFGGGGVTGNINLWNLENDASAMVRDNARITATAPVSDGWTVDIPGLPGGDREAPAPGPDTLDLAPVTLNWRDEVDIRAYARVEELHLVGLFKLLGTFGGAILGTAGNPNGSSVNVVDHTNNASAVIGDGVHLTAVDADGNYGDIGVRARTDEFLMAISPSSSSASGVIAPSATVGIGDITTSTRATVAASARLTGRNVTVAADQRLGVWGITGAIQTASNLLSFGVGLAGMLVDSEVTARVGDPKLDEDDETTDVVQPGDDAGYTVRAEDLTVRARSWGDVAGIGIQGKLPQFDPGQEVAIAGRAATKTTKLGKFAGAVGKMPGVSLIGSFLSMPGLSSGDAPGFAGSVAGAVGFSVVDVDTTASLRNVRVGGLAGGLPDGDGADIRVIARREIEQLNVAGALGITALAAIEGDAVTTNLAATIGLGKDKGTTAALVEGVRVDNARDLDVIASRSDGALVAGLSAATTASANFSVDAAASGSLYLDETTTEARVADSVVDVRNDTRVLAVDDSRAAVGAGAGTFSASVGAAGAGLTMGMASSERTITADVVNSTVTAGDDLRVQAARSTLTTAVGASVSVGSGITGNVSLAFVNARDKVEAGISKSTLRVGGDLEVMTALDVAATDFTLADVGLGGRELTITADASPADLFSLGPVDLGEEADEAISDESVGRDLAIAGGVSAGGLGGAGISVAVNDIANKYRAKISDTRITGIFDEDAGTVDMPDNVRVRAINQTDVASISIGATKSSGAFAASGNAAASLVDNTVVARMYQVTVEPPQASGANGGAGAVHVQADDAADTRAVTVSRSLSGPGATGAAAVAVNKISSTRTARIRGGDIDAHDVTVDAVTDGLARATGIGFSATGGALGGAGSIAVNLLDDRVTALIDGGADVEARDSVVVSANARQRARAIAGAGAASGAGAGVGGTAPVNRVATDVSARIGDSLHTTTRVVAHGQGSQSIRTGELKDESELSRFDAITFDDEADAFGGLDAAEHGEMWSAKETFTGVGVSATSLQTSASVGASLAGGTAAGVALGATFGSVSGSTTAHVENADITAGDAATDASVAVRAASQVHTADIALIGSGGGTGGVSAGIALSGVNRLTQALIEDTEVTADSGAVDVDAKTRIASNLLAVSLAGAGVGGVAGQAGVVRHAASTLAGVADTALTAAALDIDADADNEVLAVVGSGSLGGTGGVGVAGGVLLSGMQTAATLLGNNVDGVDIADRVSVQAATDSSLGNHVVGITGGGVAGVAGSVAYSEFANNTQAKVQGTGDDRLTLGSDDDRLGLLDVGAEEDIEVRTSAGSIGVGIVGAGVGGAAAMVVGRSIVGTTLENVDARAQVIDIDAERDLRIRALGMSGAVGAVGGLAGGASLIVLGDAGMGELDSELDAGGDGSLSLVGDLSPQAEDLEFDDELADDSTRSAITGAVEVSPSLGDGGDRVDGAIVDIDDARLDSSSVIDIDATTRVGTKSRAGAGAIGAIGGAGAGVARTVLASETKLDIAGSALIAGHSMDLSATALDRADKHALDIKVASGAASAILSFGGSWVYGKNDQTSVVDVEDSYIGAGHVHIEARTDQSARAEAFAGAIAGINSADTKVELDLDPSAEVRIDGGADNDGDGELDPWAVGGLDIDAGNDLGWDHRALGTGVGGGSFVGARAYVDLAADSDVALGDGFAVALPRGYRSVGAGIRVHARNELTPFGEEDLVAKSIGGGAIAVTLPKSETTVDNHADVVIGADVVLDGRGGDPDGRGGDVVIGAANELVVSDHVRSTAGGAALAVSAGKKRKVTLTGSVGQAVRIDGGARVMAARDLAVHTRADLDLDTGIYGSTGGAIAGTSVKGLTELTVRNTLEVHRTAELGALRDVVLDAGSTSTTEVALDARAFARALGGIAKATADVDLTYDTVLNVGTGSGTGGTVRAGRDVRLTADAGSVDANERWETLSSAVFYPIRDSGGSASVDQGGRLTLGMPIEAGYLNDLVIDIAQNDRVTIEDSAGRDISDAVLAWTFVGLAEGFNPAHAIARQIDALDGTDTNAEAILARLAGVMPDTKLSTVEVGDLVASAGDIVIETGSDSAGAGVGVAYATGASLTANAAPNIAINNASDRYLRLVGDLRMRTGSSGRIEVGDQANGSLELPADVAVERNGVSAGAGERLIAVRNTIDMAADEGDGPPAIFVEGAISNPGGTVRLYNASGDVAQFDSVLARRLDIDVPNGVFTVNKPNGTWAPGSTSDKWTLARFYERYPRSYDCPGLCTFARDHQPEGLVEVTFDIEELNGDWVWYDEHPDFTPPPRSTDGALVRAEWIGINAEYIDMNTDIEAGSPSSLPVYLGDSVLDTIRADAQQGNASGYLELELQAPDGGDARVDARYNRAQGRIEIEPLVGGGVGGVHLNGRIYSTVHDADITVHRGAADIDIDNDTGIPIELTGIEAGSPGSAVVKITDHFRNVSPTATTWYVDGTEFETNLDERETRKYITIGDYENWGDVVDDMRSADGRLVYRISDSEPEGYSGPEGATYSVYTDDVRFGIGADTSRYRPVAGIVHEVNEFWIADGNGYKEYTSGKTKDVPDPLVDWDSEAWLKDFELEAVGSRVRVTDHSMSTPYDRTSGVMADGSVSSESHGVCCFGKKRWSYEGQVYYAHYRERHTIKADYGVGIDFIGGSGEIDVASNAGVHLAGSVSNASGDTTIRAERDAGTAAAQWTPPAGADTAVGVFSAAEAVRVTGHNVMLAGSEGIGTSGDSIAVRVGDTGAVRATSQEGSIYLAGTGQGDSALRLGHVHADQGRASIRHAGALVNAEAGSGAVVRAGAIDLDAERIGSRSDRLRIELTDADLRGGAGDGYIANAVNARGATGVHLEAVSGDLLVGQIATNAVADGGGTGDISLVASGDGAGIRAASNRETDFDDVVDDNKAIWLGLGLIDDGDTTNGVGVDALRDQDVASFEANVEHTYREHWRLSELVPGADDLVRNPDQEIDIDIAADSAAYDYFQPLSGADDVAGVEAYIEGRVDVIRQVYAEAFPNSGLPALSDEAFDYNAGDYTIDDGRSVAQVRRERYKAWTLDELAAPLPADAEQAVVGSVLDNTPVHIAATGDVTLEAAGDIGRVLPDAQFNVTNEWTLPEEARAALLTAGPGDITCQVGSFSGSACSIDDETRRFDFVADANANPGEDTTFAFTIEQRQALRVDAQGTLNATTTGGSALLGDGDADDGLTVGTIDAADELRLLSTAAITAEPGTGLLLDAADGVWMTSATGVIGTAEDPITVAVDGPVQNAIASDGVYLEAATAAGHGGSLSLGRIEATGVGTIGVSGGGDGYIVDGGTLTAATLDLDYLGTFGTEGGAPTLADGLHVQGHLKGGGRLVGVNAVDLGHLEVDQDLFLNAGGRVQIVGTVAANGFDASGQTFDLTHDHLLDVTHTADLGFSGGIDIAGDVEADTLLSQSAAFTQAGGSVIRVDTDAEINTSAGDIAVADVRSTGTASDTIALNAAGAITSNGTTRPDLTAVDGGIQLDAGADIGAASDYLVVKADSLQADADGSAWIELLGEADITDLGAGQTLGLRGSGELVYGRIQAQGGLELSDFSAVRGDAQRREDGGTNSLLSSAGHITIDVAGDVDADLVTADDDLAVTGAVVDIGTVNTGGGQTYTSDSLTYGSLEAGTWQGGTWGEGEVDSVAEVDANVAGALEGGRIRATGRIDLDAAEIGVTTLNGAVVDLDATSDIDWADVVADGDVLVEAGGKVSGSGLKGGTLALNAGSADLVDVSTIGDQEITTTGLLKFFGSIETQSGTLTATGDIVELSALPDSSIVAGGNVRLTAEDRLDIASLTTLADSDAVLRGNEIELNNANIAGDLTTISTGSTRLGRVESVGGQNHSAGAIEAQEVTTGGSLSMTAETLVNAVSATLASEGRLSVDGQRIRLQSISGGSKHTVRATDGIEIGHVSSNGAITLEAGDDINGGVYETFEGPAGEIDSGGGLTATAGGAIELTDVVAEDAQVLHADGNVGIDRITGNDSLAVTGAAIDIDSADTVGSQTWVGDSLAYGTLEAGTWTGGSWAEGTIDRTGSINASDIADSITGDAASGPDRARATGEIVFAAPTIDVDTLDGAGLDLEADWIDATTLRATTDIDLKAVTDITVFEIAAGADLDLEAGGLWSFTTLRTGGDIAASATGGIDGGTASAGGTASFRAGYADAFRARAAGGGTMASGDLALDGLAVERARLHTMGTLDVADPHLSDGLEVRADSLSMTAIDTDGGAFDADMAGAAGGRMKTMDLTVTGAERITFDRLYTDHGHFESESDRIDMEHARVTGELEIDTPAISLLVKNDQAIMQDGYDTQVYAESGQFWLRQDGVMTRTSAMILNTPYGAGTDNAEALSSIELSKLHNIVETAALHLDPTAWMDGYAGSGPHPDQLPAIKMSFECTLPFSYITAGRFPGLWSANDGDCVATPSSREPERRI